MNVSGTQVGVLENWSEILETAHTVIKLGNINWGTFKSLYLVVDFLGIRYCFAVSESNKAKLGSALGLSLYLNNIPFLYDMLIQEEIPSVRE